MKDKTFIRSIIYYYNTSSAFIIVLFYFQMTVKIHPLRLYTFQYHHRFKCACIWTNNSWFTLQWRHNGYNGVSNHQRHHCLLNSVFRRRSKKASKLRVTCHCAGNSPVTGEFPAQMASNAENVSISWRHHDTSVVTHFVVCGPFY